MSPAELLNTFFSFLNAHAQYAVLRNWEGLPDHCESRDIDIVLHKDAYCKLRAELFGLVEMAGWKVITYLRSDRLITWVVASREGILQWDFFFDTSVFGIRLLSTDELLKDTRTMEGPVPVQIVSDRIAFLDKYLYDRAVGASYPEKYAAVRAAVEGDAAVLGKVRDCFGMPSLEACDKTSSRKMLLHAFCRSPFANFGRFLRFEFWRLRNYICSDTGFTVGFTGPDGSGKTTVIDLVREALGKVFAKAHTLNHFRPTLFGNISDVAHSAGLKKEVDANYSDPHRGAKTGVVSSFLRLCYYTTDYLLGWWVAVKTKTRITWLVFFDRYYTDIICDSRRTRIYLPIGFLYAWGRLFVPALDYNILLTASADAILARKKELTREDIDAINSRIDYLMEKAGVEEVTERGQYVKVVNESTPQEAADAILGVIYASQHNKNRKRIL